MSVVDLTSDQYHADQVDERPSLSASIAHLLCSQTPAHARAAHPKLNPDARRREEKHLDIGTVVHALLLEGNDAGLELVDAENWRTKAAQEQRDAARAAGRVPLLVNQVEDVYAITAAAREQIAAHKADPPLLTDGLAEQTLVWEEPGGVLCRSRLDWLRDDRAAIDDLKTTSRSASPAAYSKALFGVGGDVQAAFYLRGVQAVFGADAEFRWMIVETTPPYALSVVAPGPDVLTIGRKKVDFAIAQWRECLERDEWPGYPSRVCFAELPPWEEARWLERELQAA